MRGEITNIVELRKKLNPDCAEAAESVLELTSRYADAFGVVLSLAGKDDVESIIEDVTKSLREIENKLVEELNYLCSL